MADITIAMRECYRHGEHVTLNVYAGQPAHHRAFAGSLTLRADEWDDLTSEYGQGDGATIEVEVLAPVTDLGQHDG